MFDLAKYQSYILNLIEITPLFIFCSSRPSFLPDIIADVIRLPDSHRPSLNGQEKRRLTFVFHPVAPVLDSFIGSLFVFRRDLKVLLITCRNPNRGRLFIPP